jgi:hypothetical protein
MIGTLRSHDHLLLFLILLAALLLLMLVPHVVGDEPPAINPFGPPPVREDAVPGSLQLSDGTVLTSRIFLTRDHGLKVFDEKLQQQREIPLRVVRRVDCTVQREWVENEWRFKENASDDKLYTGRTYPAREYDHTITLKNGSAIKGAISGVVYVESPEGGEPAKFFLHKRDKGEPGTTLQQLIYVRAIVLAPPAPERAITKETKKPRGR